MNMRIVMILGMLVSAFLPFQVTQAATNTVQRLSVSLIGYADADYVVGTNSTGTVNYFRQGIIRFRISTQDIISEIGEATGQSFSRRAVMYLDDEGGIVIVDNQVETAVPADKASVELNWDAVASQINAQSLNTAHSSTLRANSLEYSTCSVVLKVGTKSFHLKGFSIGSNYIYDNYTTGYSYEMWRESARLIGEADLGSGFADKPVTGVFSVYYQTIEAP